MIARAGVFLAAAITLALSASYSANSSAPQAVNHAVIVGENLPRSLSDFAFFVDSSRQIPSAGVTPYRLNTPLYSDGAEKLRFVYLPAGTKMRANGAGLLEFPVGAALIKTFAFGDGNARRLIETRVLLHRESGWLALPYRWNDEQSDAALALAGARVDVDAGDSGQISYRIPNKNQCKECHGLQGAVVPIGPKARNLSHRWLSDMAGRSRLDKLPDKHDALPVWEDRKGSDLNAAARAYLDVNCAHCHRPGATASNSGLDLRWEQDEPFAFGVRKRPVAAGRGSGGHEFDIDPGHPERSILAYRMGSTAPGVAMPELGKSTVDEAGLAVIDQWIAEMEQ
ncbi:hypothetical protein GRI43_06750 [Altererythrobacter luteolus]|uniref:Cytochrome c domain-containing protein n=1 Tax=Pontixanthobacter luteolus TaxID=295089 RepID=A0A6I4V1Z3_9SPHN|nr:SO2930 family diheme c-type cytochrome [Pontixanthobacter luteolus]MXP47086.1 hypothetical protein [Pontixanthobacter luteolus]